MPKAPKPNTKAKHDPLHVQLGEDEVYSKYGRISQPGRRRKSKAQDDDEESGDVPLQEPQAEGKVRTLEIPEELDLDSVETINIDQSQGAVILSVKQGKIFILCYE